MAKSYTLPPTLVSICPYENIEDLLRKHKHICIKKDIAKRLGISRQYLNRLLKDEKQLKLSQLESIADTLGFNVSYTLTPKV